MGAQERPPAGGAFFLLIGLWYPASIRYVHVTAKDESGPRVRDLEDRGDRDEYEQHVQQAEPELADGHRGGG